MHRLAKRIGEDLVGSDVESSSPQGRFADGAAAIDGQALRAAEALGKHLLLRFDDEVVHVHLGLYGKFRRFTGAASEPKGALRWRMAGPDSTWDLRGPTACELFDPHDEEELFSRIGPDPLRSDADPQRFVERAGRSRRAIGAVLLDQALVAGIGNVYRAELCFLAGIHPSRPTNTLSDDDLTWFWEESKRQLRLGVRSGRIVTVDPKEVGRPRSRMRKGERTYVYGQHHCLRCDTEVETAEIGARRCYWCPSCQSR